MIIRSIMMPMAMAALVAGCERPASKTHAKPEGSSVAVPIRTDDCTKLGGKIEAAKVGECYSSWQVCAITTKDPRTGKWSDYRPCVSDPH